MLARKPEMDNNCKLLLSSVPDLDDWLFGILVEIEHIFGRNVKIVHNTIDANTAQFILGIKSSDDTVEEDVKLLDKFDEWSCKYPSYCCPSYSRGMILYPLKATYLVDLYE